MVQQVTNNLEGIDYINMKFKKIVEWIKKHKKMLTEIVIIFIISLFSFSIAPKALQNDTFYTVSIGNLILDNGIDMKDHFSWHEDLPYVYPHWLYDVIMSLIYNLGGWNAIYISTAILSIILGISIYEVNKSLAKNQNVSFLITMGAMYLLKSYITARAQLVTFIIFIWLIYLIEKFLESPKKIRYCLGIIVSSILVANLHVAVWPFIFVLFLPYIGEYIISLLADFIIYRKYKILFKKLKIWLFRKNDKIRERTKDSLEKIYISNENRRLKRESEEPYKIKITKNKNVKWLILLMLICALTGLMTPTGTTPYTYLYKTMQGDTVNNINEHLPLTLINNIPIMCTIIIFLAFLIFTKVKIKLSDLFMLGGLTYLMFLSRRQVSVFVLIGSVILNKFIVQAMRIYNFNKILVLAKGLIEILGKTVIILFFIWVSIKDIGKKKTTNIINIYTYPIEAADWILENLDVENIRLFNEYNYGSYLLFRGIPVFIDSRADLYAPEFNGGKNIFMDFINTSNISTYYGSTFEKYDITHVIVYENSKINMLIKKADEDRYKKLYEDDSFVIYEVLK